MTSISAKNDYPFRHHKKAFQTLIEIFEKHSVVYFLIGGQARDLLLSQRDIHSPALTRDIDFAVMVQDFGQFSAIHAELLSAGFEKTSLSYRILWTESRTMIDLLPFGGIADKDVVHFPPTAFDLSVMGFLEIVEDLERHFIDREETVSIPIAPLHGIFLLKVISWDDRPEMRGKDLGDLGLILNHYWDFFEDEGYDRHLDVFDLKVVHYEAYGARILGRHLAKPLLKSSDLRARFLRILNKQAGMVDPPGPMLLRFSRETWDGERNIAYGKELLDQLLLGIGDMMSDSLGRVA